MSFKVGDTVRLKSGSPVMTVIKVQPDDTSESNVACAWFSGDEEAHNGEFPGAALEMEEDETEEEEEEEEADEEGDEDEEEDEDDDEKRRRARGRRRSSSVGGSERKWTANWSVEAELLYAGPGNPVVNQMPCSRSLCC
jgi:uncharacterized protein YodC (DUF2158 family)